MFLLLFAFVILAPGLALALGICACVGESHKWLRFFGIFTGMLLLEIAGAYAIYRRSAEEAFRSTSPDGNHVVVVYALPNFSMMPGSGSDGPAIARLYTRSGKQLRQTDVEMLQLATIEWQEHSVIVAGLHEWELSQTRK